MVLQPLKSDSLVEVFVKQFEELILSGTLAIGQKIPSERELAKMLGVSRPVVHEGIIILEQKGLLSIKPRHGVTVNDYRTEGSLSLLQSLVRYGRGQLDPSILESLLDIRKLIELESVRLAALKRNEDHVKKFMAIIKKEKTLSPEETDAIVETDFQFHHLIALAGNNVVYPLLLNSFKHVYTNLTYQFFLDAQVVNFVFNTHEQLTMAIVQKNGNKAVRIMTNLLEHGEFKLRQFINSKQLKEAL